ncbi:MAG: molecular chaperone DnaK, partial [Planctomycetaceae bacterium]
ESYLKLNPRHKKLAAIHQQLIDRIERSPRKYSGFPYVRKKSQGLKTVLGIDLGNTNSVVSVMDGSKAMVIPNLVGDRSTPSVVAFASDGEILVGEPARRQAVTNPLNTFDLIRQRLGRQGLDSCPIAQRKSHNPGENESGQVKRDDQQASAFRREYSPQEFCVNLLQNLKAAAESHLGYTVSRSVITVPSSFGLIQRRAMKEAGKIAGLDVLRIIAAPTAAALAYSFQFQKSPDRNIVVCDIGGGAFSTSVCSVFDTWVEVISTTGDAELGGVDFDMALVNSIAADFKSDSGIDIRTDPTSLWRLCDAVEKAKKSLSSVQVTDVNLPFITTSKLDAKHLQASVTRVEFERLIDPLLKRMKKCIENAMRDARMTNDEIDEVMLVGGGARIPKLRSEISEMFGVDKLYNGIEAEEAASVGAAIQGSIIAGEFADRCLMDVTSISLGVETEGGVMTSLVDRNFTIPTTKSEVFSTVRDNQTEVVVSVYEGERAMACDNSLLGRYKIDGIEPAPRGTPKVEVTFDIDVDGTLNVSAKNMANGNEFSVCPGEPSNPRQAELCSESDQVDIPDQLMVIDRDVVPDKTENSD